MFKAFWVSFWSLAGVLTAFSAVAQVETDFQNASTPELGIASDVLSDGSFQYSVPIEVPVFRGLEPNLDLRYVSSFNGFGTPDAVLGAGWKLSALSSIDRVSVGGGTPLWSGDQDIVRLDGQDLLLCADAQATNKLTTGYAPNRRTNRQSAGCTAGGNLATYTENYAKILADSTRNEVDVYRKNGTKLTYQSQKAALGLQVASGVPAYNPLNFGKYLLTSVSDVNGNTVKYGYHGAGSAHFHAPRLTSISYHLPDNTTLYSIYLDYDVVPATVARPRYATGTAHFGQQAFRLRTIRVYEGVAAAQIRAYQLSYTVAAQTRISLLNRVQRYGSDFTTDAVANITGGTKLGAPYTFTYSPDNFQFVRTQTGASVFSQIAGVLDLDQNGREEVLVRTGANNKALRVYEFAANRTLSLKPVAAGLQNLFASNYRNPFSGAGNWKVLDRIFRYDPPTGQTFFQYTEYFRNAQSRNSEGETGSPPVTRVRKKAIRGITRETADALLGVNTVLGAIGNFDLDPGLEVLVGRNVHQLAWNGTIGTGRWYNAFTGLGARYMADINGDGQDDIFGPKVGDATKWLYYKPIWNGGASSYTGANPLQGYSNYPQARGFGDVNGDGAQDLIVMQPRIGTTAGKIAVHLSNGWRFTAAGEIWYNFHISEQTPNPTLQVRDMNGDGLADVVVTRHCPWVIPTCLLNHHESLAFISTGKSFARVHSGAAQTLHATHGSKRGVVADVDGDGIGDIVGKEGNVHLFGAPGAKNVLTSITEPLGGTQTITYAPSAHYNDNKVPRSYPVVSSITRANGFTGQERRTDFSYVSNRFDYELRRTVGFRTITATLPRIEGDTTRPQLVTVYEQNVLGGKSDTALKGRVKSRTLIRNGTTWWQELNDWTSTGVNSSLPKRAWKIRSHEKVLQGTTLVTRTTEYARDLYGELTRITELGYDGTQDDRTTWFSYNRNLNAYIVNTASQRIVNTGSASSTVQSTWLAGEYYLYDGETEVEATPPTKGRLTQLRRMRRGAQNAITRQTIGTYTYDTWGNLLTETDAKGRATTHSYDATKHLFRISTTNPAGHITRVQWHQKCQRPRSGTDPNGLVTTYTHDVHCRETRERHPNGHEVSWSYNSYGTADAQYVETRAPSASTATGSSHTVSRQYFDGLGQVYKEVSSGGSSAITDAIVTLSRFDKRGNLAWTSIPLSWAEAANNAATASQRVSFEYDTLGRVTKTTAADGSYSTRSYGVAEAFAAYRTGQNRAFPFVEMKDADCFDTDTTTTCGQTRSILDARGNVIRSGIRNANPASGTRLWDETDYAYDLLDQLIGVRDPGGAVWAYTYDAVGNRRSVTDPGLGSWTMTYDATDNLLVQTDAKRQTTTYTYDSLDRVLSKTVAGPGLTSAVTRYTYDQARGSHSNKGHLTSASITGTHSVQYDYNNQGLLAKERHTLGSRTYELQAEYYGNGALKRQRLPNAPGATTTGWTGAFTYDAANRVTGFGTYITGITYDLRHNPTEILYGNTTRAANTFSRSRGWMDKTETRTSAGVVMARTQYARSATGRVKQQWTTKLQGNLDYRYDYAGRLTAVTNRSATDTALSAADRTAAASFNQSFTYDAAGNMLSNSRVGAYSYLPGTHRPTTVAGQALTYDANGNMTTGYAQKAMRYDGENRLTSVTFGGKTTSYVYGADGTRLKKTENAGTTNETITVTFGDVEIRNFGQGSSEKIITYPHADMRLVNGVASYLHRDQLQSVRLITGTDGAEDTRILYHPFGQAQTWITDPAATTETKGFIGERYDTDAGLQFLNARYLDPELAIFTQPDWLDPT